MNKFDLVCRLLPSDVSANHIRDLINPEEWNVNSDLALASALRKSHRINWHAYLTNNPDVMQADIDPILHFLQYGVFESRKLYSWNPLRKQIMYDAPKVSIIITNYNNELFIDKCLNSVVNQTLRSCLHMRLSKGYEIRTQTAEAMIKISHAHILLKRM